MKTLILLENDYNSDVRVLKEVSVLEKNDIEYHILCLDLGNDYENDNKITRISCGKFLKNKLYPITNTFPIYFYVWNYFLQDTIKKFKPDFIHVHDLPLMVVIKKIRSRLNKLGIKVILDLHENFPYAIFTYQWANTSLLKYIIRPELWAKKEIKLLNCADRIIVLDNNYADQLKIKYPILNNKTFIEYPNYSKLKYNKNQKGISLDIKGPLMFYFGRIGKSRGISDSLLAMRELINEKVIFSYLIIGPVDKFYKKEFFNLIDDAKLKKHVHYIPWIDLSELPYYLELVDFTIAPFEKNPQTESGIANKIFQYLQGGAPILASNCKPQASLINKHQIGLIYTNFSDLVDKMKILVTKPSFLKGLKENITDQLKEDLDPDNKDVNLLEAYQ